MADDTFDQVGDEHAAMDILNEEGDQPTPPVEGEEGYVPPVEGDEDDETPEEKEQREKDELEEADRLKEEEDDEAKKKLDTPPSRHGRPTVRDITSKYPNFFKEFPDMKHSLFREQEYGKLFPTVDDARQAQDDAQSFSAMRDLVSEGTPQSFTEFLKGVGQEQGALESMSSNFLPSLYNVNRDLYYQVTQPVAVSMIRNAFKTAQSSNNENLKNAALVLSQWALGDQGYASGDKELPSVQPKQDSTVAAERQQFFMEKYNDTQSFVSTQGRQRLRAEVARGFDPNNVFPEFTRNLLINQVMEQIGTELEKDTRHMGAINSLWKKAHQAGYSGDWRDRLLTTYLSGARTVMPAIRTRIRAAAMGDVTKSAKDVEDTARRGEGRKEVRGAATPPARSNGTPKSGDIDWSRTSDLDILNDKVTYKKR